jgi:hypothetical protein
MTADDKMTGDLLSLEDYAGFNYNESDSFDSLADIEDAEEVEDEDDELLSVEDAALAVKSMVEDAVDFMTGTMFPLWEAAERFFDGESDIPKVKGRSQVTQTAVRDAIRSLKPNAMRVFLTTSAIVKYEPYTSTNFVAAAVAQQQTKFVNQLFWRSGGYAALLNTAHNAFLKKNGILKAYADTKVTPTYMNVTGVTSEQLKEMQNMEDMQIVSMVPQRLSDDDFGVVIVHDVEVVHKKSRKEVKLSDVDLTEFFVDDAATSPEDCSVIGERRNITVSKAKSMGLEFDGDWRDLDSHDTASNEDSAADKIRRGYSKKNVNPKSYATDLASHKFLLTEAYAEFDLDGTGISQMYRFWLGGTSYEYIAHERVEENPYSSSQIDPIPGAFFGRSIYDILDEDQNVQTSLLRATCDNAHLANNVRLGVHDTLVNMKDVVNPTLGAPIRFRAPGMIQPIGVTSSIGSMLPLLMHLKTGSNDKAGTTNASMGLDPDAMQSTDKDAVKNTIMLGQGQVELMCRNLVETGLKKAFDKLLRLSILHNDPTQIIELTGGEFQEVDQSTFDPALVMKTNVGLGTMDQERSIAGLQAVLAKQEEIIAQSGPGNPIAPVSKYYNTLCDLGELMGVSNMGRYFNAITPDVEAGLKAQYDQAQAAAKPPADPSETVLKAEQIRADVKMAEAQLRTEADKEAQHAKMRERMIELLMSDDLKRDDMLQQLNIEMAKLGQGQINQQAVLAGQEADRGLAQHNAAMQHAMKMEEANRQAAMQRQQAMAQAQAQAAPPPGDAQGMMQQ